MRSLLLDGTSSSTGTIIIYVVLILVLIAMLIMPYFSQKKRSQEFAKMLESIRVGDLVKTAGGVIGKVTKITDRGEIKTVILETGSKTEKSYMEFDITMIANVLKSTKVQDEKKDETNETSDTKSEDVTTEVPSETADVGEQETEEVPAVEFAKTEESEKVEEKASKPAKKTVTKKTAKKTTKK